MLGVDPQGELIPSDDGAAPELPATIAADHLRACAATLANPTVSIPDLGDLTDVVDALIGAQRHLALTLAGLANRVSANSALAAASGTDVTALREILVAASTAAGHTADALGEAAPALDVLLDMVGSDTRLT
ncbi:MAG TPA: hypothetical protein VG247_19080 [Pseudonocardiaceae bacterium]|jgi:hypothetical protein|nr:hypothetical protein [Pseudonocardiaceae bacterium]